MADFSVHDQPDFARVYDDDEGVTVRRGDLQALLDLATGSMNFASGFWDEEQVEVARKIAGVLGVDPVLVTPSNFVCQYRGKHEWYEPKSRAEGSPRWHCRLCRHTSDSEKKPTDG